MNFRRAAMPPAEDFLESAQKAWDGTSVNPVLARIRAASKS